MPKLSALTAKAAPTTADELIITDKADSNATKRITINNLPLSAAAVSGLAAKAPTASPTFTGNISFPSGKIDSSGNLGVGTSTPVVDFHVHDSSSTADIKLTNNTTGSGISDGLLIRQNGVNTEIRNSETGTLSFGTADTERMRLDSSGNLLVGKTTTNFATVGHTMFSEGLVSSTRYDDVVSILNRIGNGTIVSFRNNNSAIGNISTNVFDVSMGQGSGTCFTIDSSQNLLVGKTSTSASVEGITLYEFGAANFTRSGANLLQINRKTDDGPLITFLQDDTQEGSISVSGTTVSYNGGHLARWSRMLDGSKPENLLKGTVMTNLDEMVEWAYPETPEVLWAAGDGLPEGVSVGDVNVEGVEATYWEEWQELPEGVQLGDVKSEAVEEVLWTETDGLPEGVSIGDVKVPYKAAGVEDNEQLNHTAISSVEADKGVAGVFIAWDDDDEYNDYHLAMVGDVIIRIAEGVEVKKDDLLVSAGDGTAKPQDDDIQRSSTIAKVTSTHVTCTYDDGSFCVPCVLK